jgi:hypothetical protein
MEQRIFAADWPTFSAVVHERFSRDQHELLLHQLFNIRHTSTVTNYIDRFIALVEQLSSYTTNPDPLYFTTRFIDGLRDDIRCHFDLASFESRYCLHPRSVTRGGPGPWQSPGIQAKRSLGFL